MNIPKTPTRKYRVTYSVTRTECYEIEAADKNEAEELAFGEGEQIDDEAVSVDPVDVEEIQ